MARGSATTNAERRQRAAAGLALYCAVPWPSYFRHDTQKSVPADIVHQIMCAGWLPEHAEKRAQRARVAAQTAAKKRAEQRAEGQTTTGWETLDGRPVTVEVAR